MKMAVGAGLLLVCLGLVWVKVDEGVTSTKSLNVGLVGTEPNDSLPSGTATPQKFKTPVSAPSPRSEIDSDITPPIDAAVLPLLMAQYETAVRYPPGSQPISAATVDQYRPNRTVDVSAPFPLEDVKEPVQVSLQLDKFQYFAGEPIAAVVGVGQLPKDRALDIRLRVKDLKDHVLYETQPTSDGANVYSALLALDTELSNSGEVDFLLQALVKTGSDTLLVAAPFRFDAPVAELSAVAPGYIDEASLAIPLELRVSQAGYYFVSGNLYSQQSGEPLLHLETEGRLNAGEAALILRAHGSALKAGQDAGPYWLQDIAIERSAESGESHDRPGQAALSRYAIEGFPLTSYPDEDYEDPLAEERKAFLQKLGQM